MFGCHNCNYKPDPSVSYETSPCAACRTRKDPQTLTSYNDDPATFQSAFDLHPSMIDSGEPEDSLASESSINAVLSALSRSLRVLIGMKEKYPATFRILDAKLAEPFLSYSDLAERFRCKKQNVQYHLRKAVAICPELSGALLVNNRYTNGHSGIKLIPPERMPFKRKPGI